MTRETLIEAREAGVLTLTLNRPERRNAFNNRMYLEASAALSEAREDDGVRVVLITGSPGAFTAGTDLGEMASPGDGPGGFGTFMDAVAGLDKPLVAAVNGVGVGLGLTLLLHCDRVFIAEGARLRAPFVTLGVVPEAGSTYLLPVVIGWRNAMQVLYEADFIPAERAVALGIADVLCPPEALLEVALDWARAVARKPLGALRYTKRLLLQTRETQVRAAREREDEAFAVRVGSPENVEALRAFFEKREADFSDISPENRS